MLMFNKKEQIALTSSKFKDRLKAFREAYNKIKQYKTNELNFELIQNNSDKTILDNIKSTFEAELKANALREIKEKGESNLSIHEKNVIASKYGYFYYDLLD